MKQGIFSDVMILFQKLDIARVTLHLTRVLENNLYFR